MAEDFQLVTAVIPTRNRAAELERALRSVVAQTYRPIEIIVVDDGSTDSTPAVLERWNLSHDIRILTNEQSLGAPAARNRGLREALGTFVAGLDDDDEWHPQRIEKLMAAYEPRFSCVTSDVRIHTSKRIYRWKKKRVITYKDLLFVNQVGNQVLAERQRLLEIGGFDETLRAAQDHDLWLRLAERFGPVLNVQEPLQEIHTAHAERISASTAQLEGYLQFYRKHRHRMTRQQRKYQLYLIRRKTGRRTSLTRMLAMTPPRRWWKEVKALLLDRYERPP